MPSASEFDHAAGLLAQAAADVAVWANGARSHFGPDTLTGGALTLVCVQAVDVAEHLAPSAAGVLRDQSNLCRRRADGVRAYEAALGDYRTAMHTWRAAVDELPAGIEPPASPQRPVKPSFAP